MISETAVHPSWCVFFCLHLDICPACILREALFFLGIPPHRISDYFFFWVFCFALLKPCCRGFDLLKDASKVVLKGWSNTNLFLNAQDLLLDVSVTLGRHSVLHVRIPFFCAMLAWQTLGNCKKDLREPLFVCSNMIH